MVNSCLSYTSTFALDCLKHSPKWPAVSVNFVVLNENNTAFSWLWMLLVPFWSYLKKAWRNSVLNWIQNWSARYCVRLQRLSPYRTRRVKFPGCEASGRAIMVRRVFGVNGCGSSVSEGMAEIGHVLSIPVTSAISVVSNSYVSRELPLSMTMASSMRRIVLIWRSDTPPN